MEDNNHNNKNLKKSFWLAEAKFLDLVTQTKNFKYTIHMQYLIIRRGGWNILNKAIGGIRQFFFLMWCVIIIQIAIKSHTNNPTTRTHICVHAYMKHYSPEYMVHMYFMTITGHLKINNPLPNIAHYPQLRNMISKCACLQFLAPTIIVYCRLG